MAPKKDKKKGSKGSTPPGMESIDATDVPLVRKSLPSNPAIPTAPPLPQRFSPNPISLCSLLPVWDESKVFGEDIWTIDSEDPSIPFVGQDFALPTIVTSKALGEEVVWKRAAEFMDLPAPPAPEAEPEDAKGKGKKDDKKKDDKKKKGGDAPSVKLWEEVTVNPETKILYPHVLSETSIPPIPEKLTADPPPKPDPEPKEGKDVGEAAAPAPTSENEGGTDGENPSPPRKSRAPLPPPDITLPDIASNPTPAGFCTVAPRTLLKFEFLKAYTQQQVEMMKESEVVSEAAKAEAEAAAEAARINTEEKVAAATAAAEAAAEAAGADATSEANPESATPPLEEVTSVPGFEKSPQKAAELPQPILKSSLEREGGDIDGVMGSIFRCISSFAGSFPSPPPPPATNEDGTADISAPAALSSRPFLWEAIYPQAPTTRKPIYNPTGKYLVKVFLAGKWRMLEVDDRVPLGPYSEPLLLSSSKEGELWPTILSKAVYTLWDMVGGRLKSDGVYDASELSETANFTAFAFYVLTGWPPRSVTESADVAKLTELGVTFGEVNDYMVYVPDPDADTIPMADSPMKKLAKVLSPKKKSKKRKHRKPPPPHPLSIEKALRTSHNRIASIRESLLNAKAGESVIVFHDSLQNVMVFPILALANPRLPKAGSRTLDRPGSPQESGILSENVGGDRPMSPVSAQTDSFDEGPLILLSWDCTPPSHAAYNDKGFIPHLPQQPTPQMMWMSTTDLMQADCRVVSLTVTGEAEGKVVDYELNGLEGVWKAPVLDDDGNPVVPEEGEEDAPIVLGKQPTTFETQYLTFDVEALQPKRITPPGPPRIIIVGPPAGGKGTQCEFIKEKYGVVHLSTGDMLRAAVAAETEVGIAAKECMERGELVGDDIITEIVLERLKEEDVKEKGYLLDGYPRTKSQAEALIETVDKEEADILPPDAFLLLDVPSEVLVERVVGRRSDPETGKIYHMTFSPPEDPEVEARLVQRDDDTEDAIVFRIKTFEENMDGILGLFDSRGIVKMVDGGGNKEEINEGVLGAIEGLVDPPRVGVPLDVTVTVNHNLFVQAEGEVEATGEPKAAAENKVEEKGEEKGAEKKEEKKEDIAPEVAGMEVEGEEEEGSLVVAREDPFLELPKYVLTSFVTLTSPSGEKTRVAIPSRSTLNVQTVRVVSKGEEGFWKVESKLPFGGTVKLESKGKLEIGKAEEAYPKAGKHSIVEEGECGAVWKGENRVVFRRVVEGKEEGVVDVEVRVEDEEIAPCMRIYKIEGGVVERIGGRKVKVEVGEGKRTVVMAEVCNVKSNLRPFKWKIVCKGHVKVGEEVGEEGEEKILKLGVEKSSVTTSYGGIYVPNKYSLLFKDVLTTRKSAMPFGLRVRMGVEDVMVRMVVTEGGETVWEGGGRGGVATRDLRKVEKKAVEEEVKEGEEKEEDDKKDDKKDDDKDEDPLITFGIMCYLDKDRMIMKDEWKSRRPYYFTPWEAPIVEEGGGKRGEEGAAAATPLPAEGIVTVDKIDDDDIDWYIDIISGGAVLVSNDMGVIEKEKGIRDGWEEGEKGRKDRAEIGRKIRVKVEEGGKLKIPEVDEEGELVVGYGGDGGGKKKGGKKKGGKKGEEDEDIGGLPLPEKSEEGEWDEEQLMTVLAKAASVGVDLRVETERVKVRGGLETDSGARVVGGGDAVFLGEEDLEAISVKDKEVFEAEKAKVAVTKKVLEEERERCTVDCKDQTDKIMELIEGYSSLMSGLEVTREEYRKRKVAEKKEAEEKARGERERLARERKEAEEARAKQEKELSKSKGKKKK